MNIDYYEFKNIVCQCRIKLNSLYTVYNDVVSFYIENRDQKTIYTLDNVDTFLDINLKNELDKFGIGSDEFVSSRNNYLLLVDPEKGLEEAVREFINTTPDDAVPTHVVVLTDDVVTISKFCEEVRLIYPKIAVTQTTVSDQTSNELISFLAKEIGTSPNNLFDISDYCIKLNNLAENSPRYLDEFNKVIEEIQRNANNKIIVTTDYKKSTDIFNKIVAEMYLRFGDTPNEVFCYAPSHCQETIQIYIMRSLFDIDTHLVEETVEYFKQLPSVLISREDFGFAYHLVSKNKTLKLECTYCKVDETEQGNSINDSFNLMDIEIESLSDYYDLDTVDGCKDLKELIVKLNNLLDFKGDLITACNLIFFCKDGVHYCGVVDNLDFKVKVKTVVEGFGTVVRTLEYKDLVKCYPVGLYLDGKMTVSSVLSIFEIKIRAESLIPFRCRRNMSSILNTILITNDSYSDESGIKLSTVGLYCKNSYIIRTGFYVNFFDTIGASSTKFQLDCFGGLTFKLVDRVNLGGRNDVASELS